MDLNVVVKVTKLCNLRCAYCYETPWLADPRRMDMGRIARLYDVVGELVALVGDAASAIRFYWQGGEPLLLPAEFWIEAHARQAALRALPGVRVHNEIQTNLTRLTEAHLAMLRGRYSVGFSYDVANDLRRTAGGRATAAAVRAGIDRLRAAGVALAGGIAVVSTANLDRPEAVARFYLSRGLDVRLLNIYAARDALPDVAAVAVSWDAYLDFCRRVLDAPGVRAAMAGGLAVEPFTSAFRMEDRAAAGGRVTPSDGAREWVLLVDTGGDLYAAGDVYDPRFRYGNVFTDTVEQLFRSAGRRRRVARTRERIAAICAAGCHLYGRGCDGAYVGQCTPEEERAFRAAGRCYFAALAPLRQPSPCMSA